MKKSIAYLLLASVAVSCSRDPSAPAQRSVTLAVVGTDVVYSTPTAALPEPLQVVAADATTKVPVKGVSVTWTVVQGSGTLTPASGSTDVNGVAGTTFRPGALGTYRVRASSDRIVGAAPEFDVRVVPTPQIDALEPAQITAGGTVTVRGGNFSPIADHNAVLFDGVRGNIVAASATELRVTAPLCLPNRNVSVTVALGFAVSSPRQVTASGVGGQALSLTAGQSRTFADPAEVSCLRLPGGVTGALYLLTTHNVAAAHAPPIRFELRALNAGTVTNVVGSHAGEAGFAQRWEEQLRTREVELVENAFDEGVDRLLAPAAALLSVPQVGERASFNVLTPSNTFQKVNATARVVSARAVIYVDDEAPANGFTEQDLRRFGDLFDNPIYPTDVTVFGQPSDIDNNQRVIILLTPRINALTPRGETSFAAGYFYGCDLLPRNRCSGSNLGEIFYSMVPDPDARWGDRRTTTQVLNVVPPVLAHEVQHMIQFGRRGQTADALWLSEALAHTAEEIVGDAIQAQGGDPALVAAFKTPNYQRAQRYLAAPAAISLLAEDSPGSIELRGAAWLFLKHLRGHYGGTDLLFRLSGSTRSGVGNVTQEVGQPWSSLLRDFGVAIWADGAPELTAPIAPRQRFADFAPRAVLGAIPGGYPLRPQTLAWGDFFVTGGIAAASQTHFLLTSPAGGGPALNFVLSGPRGAPLDASGTTHLTILRVR